jgi:hypothetical protein
MAIIAKDPAAVSLGQKRWSTITDAESSAQHSELVKGFWAGKTQEERSAIMRERRKKRREKAKASDEG